MSNIFFRKAEMRLEHVLGQNLLTKNLRRISKEALLIEVKI